MSEDATIVSLQDYRDRKAAAKDHNEKEIWLVIKGKPISKSRPRFTRTGHVYTPQATRQAEQLIENEWIRQTNDRAPHTGPIMIHLQFVFTPPASWPKWKREQAAGGRILHTTKPDVDNLAKLVLDALNGHAWIDDSQISCTIATKHYGVEARTQIWIKNYDPTPTTNKETK